jgi:hypothetical protein
VRYHIIKYKVVSKKRVDPDQLNSVVDYGEAGIGKPHTKVNPFGWALNSFTIDALPRTVLQVEEVEMEDEVEDENDNLLLIAFDLSGKHRHLTQAQKIAALDHHDATAGEGCNGLAKWIKKEYSWPTYSKSAARNIIANAVKIRATTGNKSKIKHAVAVWRTQHQAWERRRVRTRERTEVY